jgi:hypothetical protein
MNAPPEKRSRKTDASDHGRQHTIKHRHLSTNDASKDPRGSLRKRARNETFLDAANARRAGAFTPR